MKNYSGYQFSVFRTIFGIYLFFHFAYMIPYAEHLFSNTGVLADAGLSPFFKVFPSFFWLSDSPLMAVSLTVLATILSLFFLLGKYRRISAFLLWFLWTSFFSRNFLISNPSLPFVGWLLIACSIIPNTEPWSLSKSNGKKFVLPKELFWGAWLLMGVSYTVSGLHKLGSPSWIDGTALLHLTDNPLSRDFFTVAILKSLPLILIKLITWLGLALEILFFPLILFKQTRLFIGVTIVLMHFGIMSLINFTDLTLGMLMFHLFAVDPDWTPQTSKAKEKRPVIFFDGVCGLCNSFVSFLFSVDHSEKFLVATLQGDQAKKVLREESLKNLDSIAVWDGERVRTHSSAIIYIFWNLGGVWSLLSSLIIIPKFVRDKVYTLIASKRYQYFGKMDNCRLPTDSERARFIN